MQFKKIYLLIILSVFAFSNVVFANEPKSSGKYNDWESFTVETDSGKVCFAQTSPKKKTPPSLKRSTDSRLFVTFRPSENIKNEVSVTSGHPYKENTVVAQSGKNKYEFFSKNNFAWLLDNKEEERFISLMKKATDLMIIANATNGTQTTDHYSMMGFTKAYNTARKVCG